MSRSWRKCVPWQTILPNITCNGMCLLQKQVNGRSKTSGESTGKDFIIVRLQTSPFKDSNIRPVTLWNRIGCFQMFLKVHVLGPYISFFLLTTIWSYRLYLYYCDLSLHFFRYEKSFRLDLYNTCCSKYLLCPLNRKEAVVYYCLDD